MKDNSNPTEQDFSQFLALSDSQKKAINEEQHGLVEAEHKRFKDDFWKGQCYICKKPLNTFTAQTPCLHWLLKPKGFKKKHFVEIPKKFGYFQILPYLRWVANEESFAKNINDLPSAGKIIELTIKYKNLEWSFSCTSSDFTGHQNSKYGNFPHYHFQMRIDKKPFIDYNDNHCPFAEQDLMGLNAMRKHPELIQQGNLFGEGIIDILNNESLIDQITNSPFLHEGNHEQGILSLQTLAIATNSALIDGREFYDLIQEANTKRVTVASLASKLTNASIKTYVAPGPGVVEQASRSKGKTKKKEGEDSE